LSQLVVLLVLTQVKQLLLQFNLLLLGLLVVARLLLQRILRPLKALRLVLYLAH